MAVVGIVVRSRVPLAMMTVSSVPEAGSQLDDSSKEDLAKKQTGLGDEQTV
jgi:hypothetical protein